MKRPILSVGNKITGRVYANHHSSLPISSIEGNAKFHLGRQGK